MPAISAEIELLRSNDEQSKVTKALESQAIAKWLRPIQVGPLAAGQGGFGGTEIALEHPDRMWMADEELGFKECKLVKRMEKEHTVMVEFRNREGVNQKKTMKDEDVQEMNPKAFEYCEDMAALTNLNEGSVLHNLRQRFLIDLIHTKSGLFCVTINPWRWLPLYTKDIMLMYGGVAENRPPHIYEIAHAAYHNILQGSGDQSILITGESGAGKTENTKKLIQYFTLVAGSGVQSTKKNAVSLEDQILEMNPVLEAFGNAKTTQNDNSSRFGKFIRIKFGSSGKVLGAEVECYLLEKSRVISQNPGERNFHIFYQLLSEGMCKEIKDLLKLRQNADFYRFTNQGDSSEVECIEDDQEMAHTDRALDILNFSADDKVGLYQMVAACLMMGEMKFREMGSDQTAIESMDEAKDVASLMGVEARKLVDVLTEPTVKVGDELIRKTQTLKQTLFAVSAVAKSMYEKCFFWIVQRCNDSMKVRPSRRRSVTVVKSGSASASKLRYIGVLDIAGFEILGVNSFEQLCINFTNERLQQFFNHFMFIKEQAEYEAEEIQWDYIDFGLDLQASIDLIEKPLGVLSLLEEQCMVPKGSDEGFAQKMYHEHLNKNQKFGKPKPSKRSRAHAHFSIAHYAGTVSYNVDGWLDKNKDPLNDCMLELLCSSNHSLLSTFFKPPVVRKSSIGMTNGKNRPTLKGRSGSFLTVSAVYKTQLTALLQTLNSTSPHFIRCIVPNYEKEPKEINAAITLHQLRCNGVLEGIRICRRGYPNRVKFDEFAFRYRIFAPKIVDNHIRDPKECARKLCVEMGLEPYTQYQMGLTKIFCRVGLVGKLERRRNDAVSAAVTGLQAHIRSYRELIICKEMKEQFEATQIVQFNVKYWANLMRWRWLKLMLKVIPMIPGPEEPEEDLEAKRLIEEEKEVLQAKLDEVEIENSRLREEVDKMELRISEVLEHTKSKDKEMEVMKEELTRQEEIVNELHENVQKHDLALNELSGTLNLEQKRTDDLKLNNQELEDNLSQLQKSLQKERRAREDLEDKSCKTDDELRSMQRTMREVTTAKIALESAVSNKERESSSLLTKINEHKEQIRKLQEQNKEQYKRLDELESTIQEERQAKRRAEKARANIEDDYNDIEKKFRENQRSAAVQREENRRKEMELNRMNEQMRDLKNHHEVQMTDLKRRHQSAAKHVQEQLDDMHRKSLKLESENQQMKTQMEKREKSYEREISTDSDYSSRARTYSGYGYRRRSYASQLESISLQTKIQESFAVAASYRSRSASSNDVLTRRVDELERENKEIERDKRMMKRELDVTKQTLKDEVEERDSLIKMVKSLRTDGDRLNHSLMREEEKSTEMERQLRKANNDMLHWKAKCDEAKLEQENLLDTERKRMREKLAEASTENQFKRGHLSNMERTYADLQEELRDSGAELERAYNTILNLQKLQKTQDKAIDRYGCQYRVASSELETLREENTTLRNKLRLQQREFENLKDACQDGLNFDDEATALENEIKRLRNDLQKSMSFRSSSALSNQTT